MKSEGPYLFLQGPSSPLFAKIAGHLEDAGQRCHRINLNMGDQIFWRRAGAVSYRSSFEKWGLFIRHFLRDNAIKTIIMLGEERPYHREAVKAAKESGVTVVAIEMGYLRPDWVTVELDGLSSNSRFSRDPEAIVRAAEDVPEPDWTKKYSQTFFNEAVADLLYYLPSVFLGFFYPSYRFHGIYHPLMEYLGWVGRLMTVKYRERHAQSLADELFVRRQPWFVFPLQLETDYQLRAHSPFKSQKQAISIVIESFARRASPTDLLAIKVHPLDNGLISWGKLIEEVAYRHGVEDKIFYFDGYDLSALMRGSKGLVTINSTAALTGLKQGLPTKVLGVAIYDIEGMTDQRPLDDFWMSPVSPVTELRDAFFRLLAASTQERGNFYSRKGSAAAARAIAERLLSNRVNVAAG